MTNANWNAITQYLTGDIVIWNGEDYIALADSLGKQPDLNPGAWELFASGGGDDKSLLVSVPFNNGATFFNLIKWNAKTGFASMDLFGISDPTGLLNLYFPLSFIGCPTVSLHVGFLLTNVPPQNTGNTQITASQFIVNPNSVFLITDQRLQVFTARITGFIGYNASPYTGLQRYDTLSIFPSINAVVPNWTEPLGGFQAYEFQRFVVPQDYQPGGQILITWNYQGTIANANPPANVQTFQFGWINATNEPGGIGVSQWNAPAFLGTVQGFTQPPFPAPATPSPTPYNATPANQTTTTTILTATVGDTLVLVSQGYYPGSSFANLASRIQNISYQTLYT